MDIWLIVALLVLGCVGGFLAGLLGIGGGMFLVPALTWLLGQREVGGDHVVKIAVATSLATILFTSVSSVRAHHKRGAVSWAIVASLAPGVVLGALAGAQLASRLPAQALAAVFAVFVAYSGVQMFIDKKPRPSRQLPGAAPTAAAGAGIGLLSSLVGAGGGFVSVPFMVWCNVPVHKAVATSAAIGFPIALAGTAGYLIAGWGQPMTQAGVLGYLYLPALLVISLASVLFAPIGAAAAHRLNVRQLKRAFALLLFVLAAYMATRAWR